MISHFYKFLQCWSEMFQLDLNHYPQTLTNMCQRMIGMWNSLWLLTLVVIFFFFYSRNSSSLSFSLWNFPLLHPGSRENAIFFLLAPNNNNTPFISFHQESILPPIHSSKCFSSAKASLFPPSFSASSSHHCSASKFTFSRPPQTTTYSSTTPRRRCTKTGRVARFVNLCGSMAAVHSVLRHSSCPKNVFFHFIIVEFDPASPRVLTQLVCDSTSSAAKWSNKQSTCARSKFFCSDLNIFFFRFQFLYFKSELVSHAHSHLNFNCSWFLQPSWLCFVFIVVLVFIALGGYKG